MRQNMYVVVGLLPPHTHRRPLIQNIVDVPPVCKKRCHRPLLSSPWFVLEGRGYTLLALYPHPSPSRLPRVLFLLSVSLSWSLLHGLFMTRSALYFLRLERKLF